MKSDLNQFLVDHFLVELTTQEAASLNGGRRGRGRDDGPGHNRGGGRRGRGQDDHPGRHR